MQSRSPKNESRAALRAHRKSLAGITLGLLVAGCMDDPIVYPNRNQRAVAGATSDAGDAGEAGDGGDANGGTSAGGASNGGAGHGGRGGAQPSGGSLGDAGDGTTGGTAPTGPVCGDGKVEPPEQCDDGNTISGDGCSAACESSCEKCEKNVCPLYDTEGDVPGDLSAFDACYGDQKRILKGPATGFTRAEVCRELVDCVRQENCGQVRADRLDIRRCWCDQDWVSGVGTVLLQCQTAPDPNNPRDPTKFIAGKCASLFQDASENGKLSDVPAAFTATALAEGRAFRLLQMCDTRICTEECVASYFNAGAIAAISADITLQANTAGESALGDLVADSQRAIAGADFAFVHYTFTQSDGDFNVDLLVTATPNRDADAPGRVLWSEALAVGFGYRSQMTSGGSTNPRATLKLYTVTLTGQQIYDALGQQFGPQVGGMLYVSGLKYSYTYNAATPSASVISELRKLSDNSQIDKLQTYTVALSEFLTNSSGPVPALQEGTNPQLVSTPIAEVLGEYLMTLPQPVAPPELNRIKRLN